MASIALYSSSLPLPTTTAARRGGTTRIGTAHLSTLAFVGDSPAKRQGCGRVPKSRPPTGNRVVEESICLSLWLLSSSHARSFGCDMRANSVVTACPTPKNLGMVHSNTETQSRQRSKGNGSRRHLNVGRRAGRSSPKARQQKNTNRA